MRAIPLLTQNLGSCSEFKLIYITKLVECPVVVSSPFLSKVLYTGHLYYYVSSIFIVSLGIKCTIGARLYNTL